MSAYDPAFDAAVMAAPIVDNASDRLYAIGELQYDGPRCVAYECDEPVDNDGEMCDACGDSPHDFRHAGDPRRPQWCACGRIRSIGGHSPVHSDVMERDEPA